ncbi:MAG: hypothetical protein ACOC8E_08935 [Planctomycetota bacterium]
MKRLIVMCAVFALALPGCGKSGDGEQKSGGKEAAAEEEKPEIDVGVLGSASVPDGFPDDVYVYEGATVVQSGKQGRSFMLTLKTSDDAAGVLKTYEQEAKASGWEEKLQHQMGSTAQRHFAKGERKLGVVINASGDETVINLVTSPE